MRRWVGTTVAALCASLIATPALGAPAPRAGAGGVPSDTPPSSVWTADRVEAGVAAAWAAPATGATDPIETGGVVLSTAGGGNAGGFVDDSTLYAYVAATGQAIWNEPTPAGQGRLGTAAGGNRVFAAFETTGGGPSSIVALDAQTGATLWTRSLDGAAYPTAVDGRVLVRDDGGVAALDGATGAVLWQSAMTQVYGLAGKVYATVDPGATAAYPNGAVQGLNPTTGTVLWTTALPADSIGLGATPLSSGRILIQTDVGGAAIQSAYDGGTGALAWTRNALDDTDGQASSADGTFYEIRNLNTLWAFDEATGRALWTSSTGAYLDLPPVSAGGAVLTGCNNGSLTTLDTNQFLCAFDPSNGAPLSETYVGERSSGQPVVPTVAGSDVYATVDAGLVAYTPATPIAVPGRIQAEATLSPALRGPVENDPTGGDQLVGLFPPGGTVLDYPVDIASAGTYVVGFRVASDAASLSPPISPQLQLQLAGVGTLATVDVPQTGGWQSWQTVTAVVTLPAGIHRMRIYIPAGHQAFDINWFEPERTGGAAARTARALPRTTAARRRSACLAGLKPSAQLSRSAIAADCAAA